MNCIFDTHVKQQFAPTLVQLLPKTHFKIQSPSTGQNPEKIILSNVS